MTVDPPDLQWFTIGQLCVPGGSVRRAPPPRADPRCQDRMAQTLDRTAVLLIAHGSRHEPANDDLHADGRGSPRGATTRSSRPAFLELAEPDIPAGGSAASSGGRAGC